MLKPSLSFAGNCLLIFMQIVSTSWGWQQGNAHQGGGETEQSKNTPLLTGKQEVMKDWATYFNERKRTIDETFNMGEHDKAIEMAGQLLADVASHYSTHFQEALEYYCGLSGKEGLIDEEQKKKEEAERDKEREVEFNRLDQRSGGLLTNQNKLVLMLEGDRFERAMAQSLIGTAIRYKKIQAETKEKLFQLYEKNGDGDLLMQLTNILREIASQDEVKNRMLKKAEASGNIDLTIRIIDLMSIKDSSARELFSKYLNSKDVDVRIKDRILERFYPLHEEFDAEMIDYLIDVLMTSPFDGVRLKCINILMKNETGSLGDKSELYIIKYGKKFEKLFGSLAKSDPSAMVKEHASTAMKRLKDLREEYDDPYRSIRAYVSRLPQSAENHLVYGRELVRQYEGRNPTSKEKEETKGFIMMIDTVEAEEMIATYKRNIGEDKVYQDAVKAISKVKEFRAMLEKLVIE